MANNQTSLPRPATTPGPPKFDRRLEEKLERAGFNRFDEDELTQFVHYAWITLSLTSPVECAFFRLVTVEGYTINEIVKALEVGEKTVRRGIQTAEDRLVAILELYREAESTNSNSAARLYGCFLSLIPEKEALFPYHRRLLDVLFHALVGFLDPVPGMAARMAWGTDDAEVLAWPYKEDVVPAPGSLIPGVLQILMSAAEYTEASRICRCMIALSHDKTLSELWRTVLEVIQPKVGMAAQGRAEMELFRVARKPVGYAILAVVARGGLCWPDLCAGGFRDLAGHPLDERVQVCYFRFLFFK